MAEEKQGNLSLLFAFIAGAFCGALAGILLAPSSGKETREKIKEGAEKVREKADGVVKKAIEVGGAVVETIKEEAPQIIAEVKTELNTKKSAIAQAVEAGKKAMVDEIEKIKQKA